MATVVPGVLRSFRRSNTVMDVLPATAERSTPTSEARPPLTIDPSSTLRALIDDSDLVDRPAIPAVRVRPDDRRVVVAPPPPAATRKLWRCFPKGLWSTPHGRTPANAGHVLCGATDEPKLNELDAVGERQARHAGLQLRHHLRALGLGGDAVAALSSPLRRSRQTAEQIEAVLGRARDSIQTHGVLCEHHCGQLEQKMVVPEEKVPESRRLALEKETGLTIQRMDPRGADARRLAAAGAGDVLVGFAGGESLNDVIWRARFFRDHLIKKHETAAASTSTVIVSHSVVSAALDLVCGREKRPPGADKDGLSLLDVGTGRGEVSMLGAVTLKEGGAAILLQGVDMSDAQTSSEAVYSEAQSYARCNLALGAETLFVFNPVVGGERDAHGQWDANEGCTESDARPATAHVLVDRHVVFARDGTNEVAERLQKVYPGVTVGAFGAGWDGHLTDEARRADVVVMSVDSPDAMREAAARAVEWGRESSATPIGIMIPSGGAEPRPQTI